MEMGSAANKESSSPIPIRQSLSVDSVATGTVLRQYVQESADDESFDTCSALKTGQYFIQCFYIALLDKKIAGARVGATPGFRSDLSRNSFKISVGQF